MRAEQGSVRRREKYCRRESERGREGGREGEWEEKREREGERSAAGEGGRGRKREALQVRAV